MSYSRPRRGFTLIEILVVIAIIIVLAALGFGLGGKMTKAARAATCTNNLRQVMVPLTTIREEGLHTGGNTPPGCFPPYAGHISAPSKWRKFNILELLGEEAGFCEFDGSQYRWSVHPSETFLQNPLAKDSLGGTDKDPGMVNLAANKDSLAGGWAYNSLIERWVAPHSAEGHARRTTLAKVPDAGRTIIMAEQNQVHPEANKGVWMGPWEKVVPAGTYQDSAHCLFVDGHVERLKNDYLNSEEGRNKHIWLDRAFR